MKEYENSLRTFLVEMPPLIYQVEGIRVFGRTLRSFLFSTDIALLRNTNADAVMAMYPFSTQPLIHRSLLQAADLPIFVGVGSVGMSDEKVVSCALDAEAAGATGIVVGPQVSAEMITRLKQHIDLPLIVTVASPKEDLERKIDSGADILNISGAQETPGIIRTVKEKFPYIPVVATGGPNDASILETIKAGADAISFTPPSIAEIFSKQMEIFREQL
ncbi:MAG: hydrolase [Clostridia bacterium]|nr:hydrolase [Clostridia bacterium]